MNYQTFNLTSQFTATAVEIPRKIELSDQEEEIVESVWQVEAKRTQGYLFNGKLLSMRTWDENHLEGEFVDYKYYIAQLRAPQLQSKLRIRPISISGMTNTKDKVLFGLRGENVTQNPLFYELAPSGGIDPSAVHQGKIDFNKQITKELYQETVLEESDIEEISPMALVYSPESQSFEFCVNIRVKEAAVTATHPTNEYIRFFWVEKGELSLFVAKHHKHLIPLSKLILEIKGLI